MLRFEGTNEFPQHGPEAAWGKLSDARFLVECIPDVHQVKEREPARAVFVLRPGFAFIRGTLEVTLQVIEAASPSTVRLSVFGKGIGSSSEVEATLQIAPREGSGSTVRWVAEVKKLGGLLRAVPSGLIRGAAQKVINDAWTNVEARLASAPPSAGD